ncbi:5-formyltetrahydrofolate cyclo-ligase [Stemphylium lycopersici]|uniref:5-formyltetrahydrofolate cyclo-ligase n=1 Tax=Stemphylium lycopersici TaxID=183478 RepID=A0A364MVE1_STELY|nr:5-formyltetrahydrofolate cyclo-ligase [Stemphylium lycopersici]RAR01128.1 5-formyltetrahydrofolate cyclo-ligase [Stemphylium lycopersici]RAR04779.1 5-formyltetrahydrofolate cyclo-ligase [Stemphylium lycopersici]
MATPATPLERRKLIWARVYQELIQHAVPDARFNYDFLSFVPDFRSSELALTRLTTLPCYASARCILVTPDNSLEALRARALRDGKHVLVATYRLRRGFILLHPGRIDSARYEVAASLDGMEKPGIGRPVTLAQMRDEGLRVDICVTGGLVFNVQGVTIWEGENLFEVQWALLRDIGAIPTPEDTPVVAVAHECQVVDEVRIGMETMTPARQGEVQADFVITPEATFEVNGARKPVGGIDFENVDQDALQNIPPLQELRGIRMMEGIMQREGFVPESEDKKQESPSADEQMGINIVDRLMQNYKS